jgi:hypothetical protein
MDEAKSMTTTMNAVPPGFDVRRTVAIDFLFLDLSTCERCSGTGANIETALAAIEDVLRATGARVELRKIHVQSVQQARELRFVSSPTVRVNGRDIALELLESDCGTDVCGCGPGASCRVWRYDGQEYTQAPVGLIVDAVLSGLYAGATQADSPVAAYELPDNLVRVFAAKDAGMPGGRCCG